MVRGALPGDALWISDTWGRASRWMISDGRVEVGTLTPGLYRACIQRAGNIGGVLRFVKW